MKRSIYGTLVTRVLPQITMDTARCNYQALKAIILVVFRSHTYLEKYSRIYQYLSLVTGKIVI